MDVTGGVVDVSGRPVPEQLAGVLAAADARIPVLVTDPVHPLPPAVTDPDGLPGDAFLVASTSGSSGAPRAVVRTLASWTASFDAYTALIGLRPGDRVLLTGPLTSTMQLFAAVHAVAVGAVVTDDQRRATSAVCVPAALDTVVAGAPALRTAVVAGARLTDHAAARAISAGITVIEYYGAAELSFVAARRVPGPLRPFPGVQVQIREGELWSRSPFHALGLRGSAGALRTDADGFATVGDLGAVIDGVDERDRVPGVEETDAELGLVLHGRGDAAVTVGGRTVVVEDVESALAGLDGVTDAAVLGTPHPRLGAVLVAVVVLAAEDDPAGDLTAVRRAAAAVLHDEWLPRRWVSVPALPHTSNGKIDRSALRDTVTR